MLTDGKPSPRLRSGCQGWAISLKLSCFQPERQSSSLSHLAMWPPPLHRRRLVPSGRFSTLAHENDHSVLCHAVTPGHPLLLCLSVM